jgi:succinate dehydrogenase / fumarate reductase membrane anchor subunit
MVKKHSSWGKINWLVARITAVIIMAFVIDVSYFWLSHHEVTFLQWGVFLNDSVHFFLLAFALISILFHAWIGIWTVLTDYVKCKYLQVFLEILFVSLLSGCLLWGFYLLGGY